MTMRPWILPAAAAFALVALGIAFLRVDTRLQSEAEATRALLDRQANATRTALLAEVARQGDAIRTQALAEVRHGVNAGLERVDAIAAVARAGVERADFRLGQTLAVVDRHAEVAEGAVVKASETLAGVRADLQPVLQASAGAVKDAQDSWDDLYPDVKASVASGTVAIAGIGRAADEVARAAPVMRENSTAIMQDFRRTVDDATKPKKPWEKALGPVYVIMRIVAAFL